MNADSESATPIARRGIWMVALAGVFWSLQGPTIRLIDSPGAEPIIFWRSVSQGAVLLALVAVLNRGRLVSAFARAGWVGVIGGLCALVASSSFVFALEYTTVAHLVFFLAASPFFAAMIARVLLGERIRPRTLFAMSVALAGIGVMTAGGGFTANLIGNAFALATTIGFAGIAVVARWGRGINMLPATCWGALFTMVVIYIWSAGEVYLSAVDIAYAFFSGGVLTASGAALFLLGARYVQAGVLAFLSLTEVVLAPIWVWLAFDEIPPAHTLAGGAIVLGAIVLEGVLRWTSPSGDDETPPQASAAAAAPRRRTSMLAPVVTVATGAALVLVALAMVTAGY